MATVKSMTVTLKAGKTSATLPDNRVMRPNVSYAISMEDYTKISEWAKNNIVDVVANTSNTIVPLWDAANYALDLLDINDKADIDALNADTQAEKVFKLGEVIPGFGDDLFMLVTLKNDAAAPSTSTKNVAVWSDRDNHEVSVNTDTETGDFAGVLIGATTGGQIGWMQISGIVPAAAANAVVKSADAVVVNTASDGEFTDLSLDEIQTVTLTDGATGGTWDLSFEDPNGLGTMTASGLARNISAANLKTALVATDASYTTSDFTVARTGAGTQADPYAYQITFQGALSEVNVDTMTSDGASLTASNIAHATTVPGVAPVNEIQTIKFGIANGAASDPSPANEKQDIVFDATLTENDAYKVEWPAGSGNKSVLLSRGAGKIVVGDIETAIRNIAPTPGLVTVTSADTDAGFTIEFTGVNANTDVAAVAITDADTSGAGTWAGTATVTENPKGRDGGTFSLTFTGGPQGAGGHTSAGIAYNADAATVEAAIDSITEVGYASVTKSGQGDYIVTFDGTGAETNVAQLTSSGVSLTGANQPYAIAHDTTQAGVPHADEQQTITLTDGPTGGTFTITWEGQTTGTIANNATAATVKTALEALSNIGVDEVTVSRTGSGTQVAPYVYTITFVNALGGANQDQATSSGALLTASTITHATVTTGGSAAGGTVVGTALSDSAATLAEVKLNPLTPTGNHKRRRNLFFEK